MKHGGPPPPTRVKKKTVSLLTGVSFQRRSQLPPLSPPPPHPPFSTHNIGLPPLALKLHRRERPKSSTALNGTGSDGDNRFLVPLHRNRDPVIFANHRQSTVLDATRLRLWIPPTISTPPKPPIPPDPPPLTIVSCPISPPPHMPMDLNPQPHHHRRPILATDPLLNPCLHHSYSRTTADHRLPPVDVDLQVTGKMLIHNQWASKPIRSSQSMVSLNGLGPQVCWQVSGPISV